MPGKAVISEIEEPASDGINPVLLTFQNGNLTNIDNTEFFLTKDFETKSKSAVMTVGANVYQGDINEESLTKNYIAIRNKTTNKVRLITVDTASLINNIYSEKAKEEFGSVQQNESYQKLLRNFGGKKAKRYLDRVEKMKIDVSVVKDQLEKTVDEVDTTINSETVSTEDSLNKIRPICQAEAKKLDDVYNFFDVIPKELLDRLDAEATAVVKADIDELPIKSEFLIQKLSVVRTSSDPTSAINLKVVKAIIYLDALTALVKTKAKHLNSVELSGISQKVENYIKKNFCSQEVHKIIRTSASTEKALCYFIVLALLISDNYEVKINQLIEHLSMPRAKIVKYAHLCNAKVRARTDVLCLCLPSNIAPLRIPFSKRRG